MDRISERSPIRRAVDTVMMGLGLSRGIFVGGECSGAEGLGVWSLLGGVA